VVADLLEVDMTFPIVLLASSMHFIIALTICSHDGGNDCRSVDLYVY
jgi:hypothetical protein